MSARHWWVIALAGAIAALLQASLLVFTTTDSVKYHVLLRVSGAAAKGDYVDVSLYHALIDKDRAVRVTKRVACVAGDVLRFERGAHWCNDQYLGRVLQRDSRATPLPQFAWNGTVPEGKVFLTGDHVRSFDSRYFGFVNAAALERLRPLF